CEGRRASQGEPRTDGASDGQGQRAEAQAACAPRTAVAASHSQAAGPTAAAGRKTVVVIGAAGAEARALAFTGTGEIRSMRRARRSGGTEPSIGEARSCARAGVFPSLAPKQQLEDACFSAVVGG